MLLTPEEAAHCECPLIRYCENAEGVIHGGQGAMHSHVQCRGPGCKIGWRWFREPPPSDDTPIRELLSMERSLRDRLEEFCGQTAHTVASVRKAQSIGLGASFQPEDIDAITAVIDPPPQRGYCGFAGKPE